ncbi:MAG: polyphosphate kinase 2 family protein, partial [Nostoc sp.]
AVANIICTKLQELNLQYPTVSEEHRQQLLQAKRILEEED